MTEAIHLEGLTRRFGDHVALDGIDLRVGAGRIFGYLGLNGAGKTTTIRILTTLLRPTTGTARVLGRNVTSDPLGVRRNIGLVGDDAGESQPSWSPREYLGYFAGLKGLDPKRLHVEAALDQVGLERAWRPRPMGTFSTGMKRRVELARALLGRPKVLFLDEPSRGLDLPAKLHVWDLLRTLARRDGVTIFLSSHDTQEILGLCQDLAVLRGGRIVFQGRPTDLARDRAAFERSLVSLLQGEPKVSPSARPTAPSLVVASPPGTR